MAKDLYKLGHRKLFSWVFWCRYACTVHSVDLHTPSTAVHVVQSCDKFLVKLLTTMNELDDVMPWDITRWPPRETIFANGLLADLSPCVQRPKSTGPPSGSRNPSRNTSATPGTVAEYYFRFARWEMIELDLSKVQQWGSVEKIRPLTGNRSGTPFTVAC